MGEDHLALVYESFRCASFGAPNKVCIATDTESVTARELLDRVDWIAGCLRPSFCVWADPTDPVNFAAVLLAGSRSGATVIVAPREERLRSQIARDFTSVLEIFRDSAGAFRGLAWSASGEAVVNLSDLSSQPAARELDRETDRRDLGCVVYTTGTTGRPVGVITPQRALAVNTDDIADAVGMSLSHPIAVCAPFHHSYGLGVGLVPALMLGQTIRPVSSPHPREELRKLARHRWSALVASPEAYANYLNFPAELLACIGQVDLCLSSGSRLPAWLADRYRTELGVHLINLYGSTETHAIALSKGDGAFFPMKSVKVSLAPTSGDDAGIGSGDLWIQTSKVTPGYWRNEQLTGERRTAEGFLTGDRGRIFGDGSFEILGRSASVIKVASQRVQAEEVENHLEQLPEVAEATVFGIPDNARGQVIAAWIELDPGHCDAKVSDIRASLSRRLPAYMVPRRIEFVEKLPRRNGKKIRPSRE